jgi:hypothetical protein
MTPIIGPKIGGSPPRAKIAAIQVTVLDRLREYHAGFRPMNRNYAAVSGVRQKIQSRLEQANLKVVEGAARKYDAVVRVHYWTVFDRRLFLGSYRRTQR